jgi:peptidoglycan/xylan/chitin deacetylase (PgdA/CDA1 family)
MIQMTKSFFKQLLSLKLFSFFLKKKVFIFVYHDISNEPNPKIAALHNTSIDCFISHIDFFKANFEIISLEDLSNNKVLTNGPYAVISFDDGLQSVVDYAMPILEKQNIPFTLFLNEQAIKDQFLWNIELIEHIEDKEYLTLFYHKYIPQTISIEDFMSNPIAIAVAHGNAELLAQKEKTKESRFEFINKETVLALKNHELISIGDHSKNHLNLNNASQSIEEERLYLDSKNYFLNELELHSVHFAIPFGKKEHYNKKVCESLYKKGYKFVYITNPVGFEKKDIKENEVSLIPRIGMTNQAIKEIIFMLNRTLFKKIDI